MLITLGMNLLNFVFGYVLIIGIDFWGIHTNSFGIAGAALALTFARAAGLIAAVIYIVRASKTIRLNRRKYFNLNFNMQKIVLGLGVPTSVESTLFQAGRLITQIFIVGMGTAALAANTVANAIVGFINVPGNAFTIGVMILIGQRVGRGSVDDVPRTTVFAIFTGTCFMSVLCLLCYPCLGLLTQLYHLDPVAAAEFRQIMVSALLVSAFIWPSSFITPASLRAVGDVRFTMMIAVFSMWAFRIAAGYIFGIVFQLGVMGVWMGMYVDWLIRSVLFCHRLLSRKWMNKTVLNH
jgi:Na+-driven multidrug efflux pump